MTTTGRLSCVELATSVAVYVAGTTRRLRWRSDSVTADRSRPGPAAVLADCAFAASVSRSQLVRLAKPLCAQRVSGGVFHGFHFSAPAKQQLMEGLAVTIHQHRVQFPDGPITAELETFEYAYTRTGVRYCAPDGLHDDCVCALALAVRHYAHEVDVLPLRLMGSDEVTDYSDGDPYVMRCVRRVGSWLPGD